MSGFSVTDVRSNFTFGGARPTLFDVQVVLPGAVNPLAARKLTFSVSGAEIPASTLGNIPIPYMGRRLPNAGDRQFAPWQINVMNDEDFSVRDALEGWHNTINARKRNIRQTATSATSLYKTNAIVNQYSRVDDQTPIRTYVFQNLWPANISGIQLDWGAVDQMETFQVVFEYDWYDVIGTNTVSSQNATS